MVTESSSNAFSRETEERDMREEDKSEHGTVRPLLCSSEVFPIMNTNETVKSTFFVTGHVVLKYH